jgi:DNA-binding HxlR family transcriptional regulator
MQRTDLNAAFCPVARTLACVGEWWSLLILRDAFQGLTRFDDFRQSLGISTNILARRLQHLTENGIFARRRYQEKPARDEYVLTQRGHDLLPVLMALYGWGNRHLTTDGIAVQFADRRSGQLIEPHMIDRGTGAEISAATLQLVPGPLAPPAIIARAQRMAAQAGSQAPTEPPVIDQPRRRQRGTAQPKTQQKKSTAL